MNDIIDDDDIMKDLDDLSDDEQDIQNDEDEEEQLDQNYKQLAALRQSEIDAAKEEFEQTFQQQTKEVSYLLKDSEFLEVFNQIKGLVLKTPEGYIDVDHKEYNLIKQANRFGSIIDKEIQSVHKYVKDEYMKKFPELEKIVLNPIEYTKTVKLMGNKTNFSEIDFSKLLTPHQILGITVAESSSSGQLLTKQEYEKVMNACDVILKLEEHQKLALYYIESRMQYIAPNLSQLVGTQCASKLMGAAGGIDALSKMPASNIQVMGSQKKALLGNNRAKIGQHRGFFGQLDFVQNAPEEFQTRLVRMLSTNVAKSCRIDFLRTCPDGSAGMRLKDLMLQRFDKIQEPQQAKMAKPIAPPDDRPKPKRGGKRFRKMKERLEQTELAKYQNRLTFGETQEEEIGDSGIGFGQLSNKKGQTSARIRVQQNKNQKLKLSKNQQKRLVQLNNSTQGVSQSGTVSSVAFTPVQGMDLVNPQNIYQNQNKQPENYFNKESGFKTVVEENKKKKSLLDMLGPAVTKK